MLIILKNIVTFLIKNFFLCYMSVKNIPKITVTICTKRMKSFIKLFTTFLTLLQTTYSLTTLCLICIKLIIRSYENL